MQSWAKSKDNGEFTKLLDGVAYSDLAYAMFGYIPLKNAIDNHDIKNTAKDDYHVRSRLTIFVSTLMTVHLPHLVRQPDGSCAIGFKEAMNQLVPLCPDVNQAYLQHMLLISCFTI